MKRNKEGKHYSSPTRYLKTLTAAPLLDLIETGKLTLDILEKVKGFGDFIEKAFQLHFDFNIPLKDIEFPEITNRKRDWDKDFQKPWKLLLDYLTVNNFLPVDYEVETEHIRHLYRGRIDLKCKDEKGNNVYIEIKTRNTDTLKILDTDLMQLQFYKMAINKDFYKPRNIYKLLVIDRKGRNYLEDEIIEFSKKGQEYSDKCINLITFYDLMIRPKLDKIGIID